jgi:hypothetical protein
MQIEAGGGTLHANRNWIDCSVPTYRANGSKETANSRHEIVDSRQIDGKRAAVWMRAEVEVTG